MKLLKQVIPRLLQPIKFSIFVDVGVAVSVIGVVVSAAAAGYQMYQQSEAADKAKAAQDAATVQAAANAKKQQEDALAQQTFLSQQAKAIKPANFEPGGVPVAGTDARGGGSFT
jgi:predicted negative regulator of RcsB-dependent stress response